MKEILIVFGTRPEALKLCPLILELERRNAFRVTVAVTGQHREMLREVLDSFGVRPQYNLAIMRKGQSLSDVTAAVLEGISNLLVKQRFDCVLVHGDTATAFAAALAAFYAGVRVAHIEAGLRTYDMHAPFPEEFDRRAISLIADCHFAPTEWARENLLKEGILQERIFVTGNTGIDALRYVKPVKKDLAYEGKRILLLTAHRRENLGKGLRGAFCGIKKALLLHRDTILVYPMHKNPAVREVAGEVFGDCAQVRLIEPLDHTAFCHLLSECYLVLTDSGGIQEEAPYFGKPVLVLRDRTERPEGVAAGVLRLVGCREESVFASLCELLDNKESYAAMHHAESPFGDGHASERIADILERE